MLTIYLLWVSSGVGTSLDREALFDYLLTKTMSRESFSPVKNERLGLDVGQSMRALRDEMLAADTEEKLFYVLVRLSNVRKDRHLSVELVPGGLDFPRVHEPDLEAPVRFFADYGDPEDNFVFIGDLSDDVASLSDGNSPQPGDRVVSVNGLTFEDYFEKAEPFHRYSTLAGLAWHFAMELSRKSYRFPAELYRERLELVLEARSGRRYRASVPYLEPDSIRWQARGAPRYPGYDLAYASETYDLYRNFEGREVLVVAWHGFRENLVDDVDRLVDYAVENDLLDHAVVFDGTRSRGGSMGAYAVQRLSPKPFKTTFGNLRLSDITEPFIERFLGRDDAEERWLLEWLEDDVRKGLAAGQAYSNQVPFKLAHLPKFSDGILEPAETHFRGPLVCLLGPQGGSHLDQFASLIVDNELGHAVGMSAGGYSNTWEWEEVLELPGTARPLVRYMWSIGHTIRPNGEVLEGNPAPVHERVPLTRDNFETYHQELLSRAYRHLGIH